jgi:hypothetical protein
MPLRITHPNRFSAEAASLQEELVRELADPKEYGQPLILERHMDREGAVHVYVIWDRLDECESRERSEIVLGAFEQARGEEFRKRILFALGLSVPEAVENGLLPYAIVDKARAAAPGEIDRVRQAMIDEGASVLENPLRPLLRYPTLEDAEAGLERLRKDLGSSDAFSLVHEVR